MIWFLTIKAQLAAVDSAYRTWIVDMAKMGRVIAWVIVTNKPN